MIRRIISHGARCVLLWLAVSLCALAATAQTETGSAVPPVSGTISGHVTNTAGEPLTNATVYVGILGAGGPSRTAIVQADGTFRVEGLEIGAYSVMAAAPGFVFETSFVGERTFFHTGDSVSITLTKGAVITGTVTNSSNEPVVAASVHAFRVRDQNGNANQSVGLSAERITDDRGIYRIYGLPPGTYVVSAGGASRFSGGVATAFDRDAPTYAPSSTRDTAMEVAVGGGEEVTVNVQYRGEAGHAISGAVAGVIPRPGTAITNANVTLTDVKTRATIMTSPAVSYSNYTFAFYGLADGEYEVVAQQFSSSDARASDPRRIKVQGADVIGVNVTVASLPSISGRIVLESKPPADCVDRRGTAAQETIITVRRAKVETQKAKAVTAANDDVPISSQAQVSLATGDARGDFILRNLHSGVYRLRVQLPSAGWYWREAIIGSNSAAAVANVVADGVTVKATQTVTGLTITLAEGAAAVRGKISAAEGASLPPNLRVYLVPAEKESATNVLRFYEADILSEGRFAIRNLAPGKYWLIVRPKEDADPANNKPIRENGTLRTSLLAEPEIGKKEITLKRCEQQSDLDLRYVPSPEVKP